jgi:predicted nucleic acid-binding protein
VKTYLDTNLLTQHYLGVNRTVTDELILSDGAERAYPVTDLLYLEMRNAMQRMVFEARNGGNHRVTQEGALVAISDLEDDLNEGMFLIRKPLLLSQIEARFLSLADRHTAKHGFRTYDILHVASALHLGCTTFFSFDKKALELAKLEGLKTN